MIAAAIAAVWLFLVLVILAFIHGGTSTPAPRPEEDR